MSATVDLILGRSVDQVNEDDVPPVMAGRTRPASMLRKEPKQPTDKKLRDKARQASVVASIIGMTESDEESIIPQDAKPIDQFSSAQIPGLKSTTTLSSSESPSEPALANADASGLIPPSAALVAPDITPKALEPIDPSAVPGRPAPVAPGIPSPSISRATSSATGALDTILGRQNPAPPGVAESFVRAITPPIDSASAVASKLTPANAGGSPMPEHVQGDPTAVYAAFRNLVG
jgi:hypothetical protein